MNERDRSLLQDMLIFARRVSRRVADRARPDLEEDDEALGGLIVRELAVIGEAASHVSQALTDSTPQIAWRAIIAMRNRIVHGYLSINWDIVWDTCTTNIPVLIVQLETILSDLSDSRS